MRLNLVIVTALIGLPVLAAAEPVATPAPTPTPTAVAAAKFSTTESKIGDLLDNPTTKAVLDKDLPGLSTNENIDMARGMTLKQVQQFAPDKITDARLATVDADFAALGK